MSAAINIYEEDRMSTAPLNDYDRTMWAMGWYLKRERLSGRIKDNSLSAFGKALDMSHSGYGKLEDGATPNLKTWFAAMDHIGRRFSRVLLLAEAIATDIAREEEIRGRVLEQHERGRIASQLYETFQSL